MLDRAGTAAWKAAGAEVWRHGPSRVIATRALATDPRKKGKQLGMLFISTYAPTTAATAEELDDFYGDFADALTHAWTTTDLPFWIQIGLRYAIAAT